jgi:hypothetical protein
MFLAQKSITEMEHPSYSPDLAPSDMWLFSEMWSSLRKRKFQDTEEIDKNVTKALKLFTQQEFQKCFQ